MQRKENLVFKDNDLAGFYTIDGADVRRVFGDKRYWNGVDEIIKLYTQLHPDEMLVTKVDNELDRNSNKSELAASKDGTTRKALSIPANLLLVLKDFDHEIITDKKKRQELMKRYPALRACRTI